MDLKQGCRVRRSCFLSHPPQHHPHHHLPHRHLMCHCHSLHICAHHHHYHHHHHHRHYHRFQHPQRQFIAHPHVSSHVTSFPRNPEPSGAVPLPNNLDFGPSGCEEACSSATLMLQEQEQEWLEEEEEGDDEPEFVLTDEWREFFAKSEAKRKLEKKQAKKKGKQ